MKKYKKFVQRVPHQRDPEVAVGVGTMLQDHTAVDPRDQAAGHVLDLKVGDKVHIARGIITAAGARYRVLNSICWLSDDQVKVDDGCRSNALTHVDPLPEAKKIAAGENRFRLSQNGDSLYKNSATASKSVNGWVAEFRQKRASKANASPTMVVGGNLAGKKSTSLPQATSGRKLNYMDKQALRTLISGFKTGQKITITFIGPKAHLSRDWTVVRTKQGRGKGGSKLMELVDGAKNLLTTGTPDSDLILNITADGTLHGYTSEADIPVAYETDVTQAAILKETFHKLLAAEGDVQVKVTSKVADFNGTFTVNKATQLRGRGGQIRLELENTNSTHRKVEMWSRRHSGVITGFTVMGNTNK